MLAVFAAFFALFIPVPDEPVSSNDPTCWVTNPALDPGFRDGGGRPVMINVCDETVGPGN